KTLTIHPNPVAEINGPDETCEGTFVIFTAGGGTSYQWNTSELTDIISVDNGDIRIVTVTDANGCTDMTSKALTIHPNPVASIDGPDVICDGNSAEFVASGGVNYLWNTGENSNTLTVNDDQIHIVTVTDINGCTDIEEKTLTLQANPDA